MFYCVKASEAPLKPRHSKGEYARLSVMLAVDVHVRMTVTFGSRIVGRFFKVLLLSSTTPGLQWPHPLRLSFGNDLGDYAGSMAGSRL